MRSFVYVIGLFFVCNMFAQQPAKTGLCVLYIGDSITDGNWGGGGALPSARRNHWDQNHVFGSGYMYMCAAHYLGYYPEREYRFYNRGISGNTLADLGGRWQEDVMELAPDVLSVLVGVNDVEQYINDPQGEFDLIAWERLYRELLVRTLAVYPRMKLVIGSPFAAAGVRRQSETEAALYEDLIRRCAEITERIAADYDAVFLPYYQLYQSRLKAEFPDVAVTHWLWDGVHPTAAAHRHMADLWIREADKWMK